VLVIRVNRAPAGQIWLFSGATLAKIPALHTEITGGQSTTLLARLPRINVKGARLIEWLAILLGVPLLYLFGVLLNQMLKPLARPLYRRLFSSCSSMEKPSATSGGEFRSSVRRQEPCYESSGGRSTSSSSLVA
jgi:hypothetical protein